MGLPVVPEEAWKRTMSFIGAAKSPKGYVSRRSALEKQGSSAMSLSVRTWWGFTPRSSQRARKSDTRSYVYSTSRWRRWSCSSRSSLAGMKSGALIGWTGEFWSFQ